MITVLLRYKYFLLILSVALVYIIAQSGFVHGDFNVFMAAADYLNHSHNPYKVWLVWNGQVTDMFSYGPSFALMLIPFTYLPQQIAFIVFFFIQTWLLIRVFIVIEKMLPVSRLNGKQRFLWWTLSILCSLRFILHNVEFGQVTILILFLAVEGLYQIFYGNKLWGSLLLGLGIHIKLMPLVFIPYLLWRKEFPAATLCVVSVALFWLTPFAFGDAVFVSQLLHDWWATVNPLGERFVQHQESLGYQMQGLQALLSAYLLDSKFEGLDTKFNLVVLSQPVFQAILQFSRLMLVLFALYFLRGTFFHPFTKDSRGFWQLSYLFLVIPIIFPQQQKYSLLLMAPFFCYMIWWIIAAKNEAGKHWKITVLCFAVVILLTTFTSDLFVGLRLNYIFQCLRILTIATLLAVPLLACAKPRDDIKTE